MEEFIFIADTLIKYGATVAPVANGEVHPIAGFTPPPHAMMCPICMCVAHHFRHRDILKPLLELLLCLDGVDPKNINYLGLDALQCAAFFGHTGCAELLVLSGWDHTLEAGDWKHVHNMARGCASQEIEGCTAEQIAKTRNHMATAKAIASAARVVEGAEAAGEARASNSNGRKGKAGKRAAKLKRRNTKQRKETEDLRGTALLLTKSRVRIEGLTLDPPGWGDSVDTLSEGDLKTLAAHDPQLAESAAHRVNLWHELSSYDDTGRPELNGRVGLCLELIDHPTLNHAGKYAIELDPIEGGEEEEEVVMVDVRFVVHESQAAFNPSAGFLDMNSKSIDDEVVSRSVSNLPEASAGQHLALGRSIRFKSVVERSLIGRSTIDYEPPDHEKTNSQRRAYRAFHRALELLQLSFTTAIDEVDMAISLLADALRQFPEGLCETDSLVAMSNLATTLSMREGRYYEGLLWARKALARNSNFLPSWIALIRLCSTWYEHTLYPNNPSAPPPLRPHLPRRPHHPAQPAAMKV